MKQEETQKYSNVLPLSHLIALSICTLGLYEIYWFYRNWKHIKEHKNLEIKPGWRTVGLFVPIFNLFLIHQHFSDIKKYCKEKGIIKLFSPGWLLLLYFIIVATVRLDDPYWHISTLSFIPLAIIQNTFNKYWEKEQINLPVKTKLNIPQIILIIIGGAIVILAMYESITNPMSY